MESKDNLVSQRGKETLIFGSISDEIFFFYLGFFLFYKVHSALCPLLSSHAD